MVVPLLTATTAYYVRLQQPLRFQSSSRMIIGPGVDSLSPELNDLRTGGQLMRTYAELAKTRSVLQDVIDQADLQLNPNKLEKKVRISVDTEAQILAIQVEDSDPIRAQVIANSLAEVLLRLSPSGGESPAAVLNSQMFNQASGLEATILETNSRIEQLESDLAAARRAEEKNLIQEQLSQERARLSEARSTLAVLYDSLRKSPTNQAKIIESATIGTQVVRRLPLIAITAGLAGLVIAFAVAFGVEYLDETLRTAEDLDSLGLLPVLGSVSIGDYDEYGSPKTLLALRVRLQSPDAKDFQMLGTKLRVAEGADVQPLKSLVISSVDELDDTSEIATSLAVVLSQIGTRVILIDANLHKPTIGKLLGISDRVGLTSVLTDQYEMPEPKEVNWAPELMIIPSGPEINNPFTKLASPRMMTLIQQLEDQADVILIALPPLLSNAESLLLASRTDGAILLVHSGKSQNQTVQQAVASLETAGAHTVGAVMVKQGEKPPLHKLKQTVNQLFRAPGYLEESENDYPPLSSSRSHILLSFKNRIRYWMSVPENYHQARLSRHDPEKRS